MYFIMIVGYTCGVYDLFHVGHVTLLKNAKTLCDKLIVGLTIDELVNYKKTKCLMSYEERKTIVESCRYVDMVIPQRDHNKIVAYNKLKYDVLFVGDDWYNNENWNDYEKELKEYGVKIVYFPYTKGVSTTSLKQKLLDE